MNAFEPSTSKLNTPTSLHNNVSGWWATILQSHIMHPGMRLTLCLIIIEIMSVEKGFVLPSAVSQCS